MCWAMLSWGGIGSLSFWSPDSDCCFLFVGSLAGRRGRADGRGDWTAGILTPQLESEPGLCSAHRWLSNPLIHSHGIGRRSGRSVSSTFAVAAVAFRPLTSHGR